MVAVAWAVGEVVLPTTVRGAPNATPPFKNCTVPVGSCAALAVALLCEFTVAVRTTVPPAATELGFAETVVVVLAFVTVTTSGLEALLLPVKLLSPA
jgi:hypothetical protein